MLGPNRAGRVGDLIRAEVVEILQRRVKDPRVAQVTVTVVDVSADLRHAKVFVSLLSTVVSAPAAPDAPQDPAMTRALAGLDRAAGFIRGELGRRLKMRLVPELSFHPDATLDRAERIQSLIDQIGEPRQPDQASDSDEAGESDQGRRRSRPNADSGTVPEPAS